MKHAKTLGKLLILFSSALFFSIYASGNVFAYIAGNKVPNGEFINGSTLDGVAYVTMLSGWASNDGISGSACTADDANFRCRIYNQSECQAQGFDNTCGYFESNGAINTVSVRSNYFIWDSNRSWGILTFYARNGTTGYNFQVGVANGTYNILSGVTYSSANGNFTNTTTRYTINVTNLVQGGTYAVDVRYVAIGSCPACQTLIWTDNFTMFGNSTEKITLTGACLTSFYSNTSSLVNNTYACETSPISTVGCNNITDIRGYLKIRATGCYYTTGTYAFNVSNNVSTSSSIPCFLPTAELFNDYGFRNFYYNKTGLFSTCYYNYTNANISLEQFGCQLEIDCLRSVANRSCANICSDSSGWAYSYENGTLDSETGRCVYTSIGSSVTRCATSRCASDYTCNVGNSIIVNQSTPFASFNMTSGYARSFMELWSSPYAVYLILLMVFSTMGALFLDEEMSLYIIGGLVVVFGLLGFLPTWASISGAVFAFSVAIFLNRGAD